MKYTYSSFSVSLYADAGTEAKRKATCASDGHMEPDAKGKCLRCGAKLRHAVLEDTPRLMGRNVAASIEEAKWFRAYPPALAVAGSGRGNRIPLRSLRWGAA